MKKMLFLLFVFGSLAAQEPNKKVEPSRQVPDSVASQITVNADEFQRTKDIIFSLALENQKLRTKKELTPLDFGYNLIQDNYKLMAGNAQGNEQLRLAFGLIGEIKKARTIQEVKQILKNYGIK